MAGIVACHWTELPLEAWLLLVAATAVGCGLILFLGKGKQPVIPTIALTLIFFALGALRCCLDDPRHDASHWTRSASLSQEHASYLVLRLEETPLPREKSWRVLTEVERVDQAYSHGALRLYLRKDSTADTLRYGDRLLAHGYADVAKGTLYLTSDHYILTERDSTSLRARCERLRMKLLRRMQEGPLEPRLGGVAEALTLGWRGDLRGDLQSQFRDAGVMHMLCVSGLHVGLLAAIVGWLLFFVGKDRRGRIVRGSVQLALIWAFALLSGLAPATVRAALMFSLFIVSHMMGRRTDTFNLLAAAAIVMLAVDPMLLFDIGWQLSFSAVAGILLSRPLIGMHRNIVWQASAVSLAATTATLPVALNAFHQVQPYFLIANVVIVPLAAFLLGFSLLYMAIPCGATAWLAGWPLEFCDWLTASISQLPGAVIRDLHPKPLTTALLTVAIFFIMITINRLLQRYKGTKNETKC